MLLGLVQQAQGQIGLDQAVERLRRVAGGLVAVDDGLEAADGGQRVALAQVVAADGHFLAGQLVVDHVDLQPRVGGVLGARIALDDLAQVVERLAGGGLVAADVDDLLEVADGLQVVGVGRRGLPGIERDEAVGVGDGLGVVVGLVVGVGLHQDRAARPLRIGVLALDFLEVVDGLGPQVAVQPVGAGGVEQLHRALLIGEPGLLLVVGRAGRKGQGAEARDEHRASPRIA